MVSFPATYLIKVSYIFNKYTRMMDGCQLFCAYFHLPLLLKYLYRNLYISISTSLLLSVHKQPFSLTRLLDQFQPTTYPGIVDA